MTAIGTYDIIARQATTLTFAAQVTNGTTPINFSSYTAVFTARPFAGSPTTWLTLTNPAIALSPNGAVSFTVSNTTMAALSPNKGVYDLVLRNASGEDEYVLEGRFVVTPAVTVNA